MTKKRILKLVLGFVLMFLGVLWFLQGSDIVHIQPILCFANCTVITGHSPLWQVLGLVAFVGGLFLVSKGLKNTKQNH